MHGIFALQRGPIAVLSTERSPPNLAAALTRLRRSFFGGCSADVSASRLGTCRFCRGMHLRHVGVIWFVDGPASSIRRARMVGGTGYRCKLVLVATAWKQKSASGRHAGSHRTISRRRTSLQGTESAAMPSDYRWRAVADRTSGSSGNPPVVRARQPFARRPATCRIQLRSSRSPGFERVRSQKSFVSALNGSLKLYRSGDRGRRSY
jgi:hypothetical protein